MATGYIACLGNHVLGGDLFARPDILQKKWARLMRSSVVEILRIKDKPKQIGSKAAKVFLDAAAASVAETYDPPGIGTGVHIDSAGVIGNVLIADDAVVHVGILARA